MAQDNVLRLSGNINGMRCYTDNFMTSISLAKKLEKISTTIHGTVRGNSKGLSKRIIDYYNNQNQWLFV